MNELIGAYNLNARTFNQPMIFYGFGSVQKLAPQYAFALWLDEGAITSIRRWVLRRCLRSVLRVGWTSALSEVHVAGHIGCGAAVPEGTAGVSTSRLKQVSFTSADRLRTERTSLVSTTSGF